ncbi:c-type cytochrome [Sulfurimonas sp.]|uniref:c-type cytochrome n=1 Tax=Sulfurimonas sp. TaxID=2022749 RepID=UPI0025FBA95A|nr:c-type cytochrome [Sulfurimonas sp.]
MFNTNYKLIATASVLSIATLFSAGCMDDGATPTKTTKANTATTIASIDGGVKYPVIGDKTGPYYVNNQSNMMKINNGRVPTANELVAWDKDVMPDGTGLPEGSGSVEDGEEIYEAQCVMCHGDFGSGGGGYPSLSKGNADELQKTLTNNRWKDPEADGPTRVFGSYWPVASTMWWYIRDGMPHTKSKTLSNDEVYALTAYMLNINEITIDGEEVDDEYVLNREKFLKIKMPNRDGFEPNIDGPNALKDVRKYYENPANFGAKKVNPATRCMKDCQEKSVVVTRVENGGISEFLPPMSVVRDLPKKEASDMGFNVLKNYEDNCMPCHVADGMGAPVTGDKEGWAEVLAKGMSGVYKNALEGINGMPAKGGASVSDDELKLLVDYMIDNSK